MTTTTRLGIAFYLMVFAGLMLGGCNDGNRYSTAAALSSTISPSSSALSISGSPAQFVEVGSSYEFRPSVSNVAGAVLTFAILNKPSWAIFDAATGSLMGTPGPSNVGSSGTIAITVSDGGVTSALVTFSIQVTQGTADGTASLSWVSPPVNSNGTLEVEGYHIYFGNSSANLTHVVNVESPNATSFVINSLPAGNWYFGVASYNAQKVESRMSAIVNVSI